MNLSLEPRNEETTITQVLNVNHATDKSVAAAEEDWETLNVPELDENGKWKANVGDGEAFSPEVCGNFDKSGGNRGIGLSTEGSLLFFFWLPNLLLFAQVLNVNHVDKSVVAAEEEEETLNVPELDENGKRKANVGDGNAFSHEVCGNSDKSGGNRGIELSTEGSLVSVFSLTYFY